jgi:hypothetical protein
LSCANSAAPAAFEQRSADLEYQLPLQVARFAEMMRFSVYKLVSDDRGRPDRTGVKKHKHPLEMSAIAYRIAFGRRVPTSSVRGGRNPCGAGAIQTSRPLGLSTV